MCKFKRINYHLAIVEYPITIEEMEEIEIEFPKRERAYYEITLKALKKILKPTEKIFGIEGVQPTSFHNGFLVLTQDELILSIHKGCLIPRAALKRIPMNNIIKVDFVIIDTSNNPIKINEGEIHLLYKKGCRTKKYIIRDVPPINLDSLVARIRGFVKAAGDLQLFRSP